MQTGNKGFDPDTCPPEILKMIARAFDQMDTMAGIVGTDQRLIFANQSGLRHVGAKLEEVQGMLFPETPWRNHSPEAREITRGMTAEALNGKRAIVEDGFRDKEGQILPAIFSVSPLFDTAGTVVGLVPEGKVITDLKRLQARLEKERLKTQQWLDSMGTYVALCDLEGKILICNRPLEQAVGDAVGSKICDFPMLKSTPEAKDRIKHSIEKAVKGEKETIEIRLAADSEKQLAFIISASPIYDTHGEITYLAVEAKDISEQIRLQELILQKEKEYSTRLKKEVDEATRALRETELLNKNLVDSAPMGIIHLNQRGELVFANPAIKEKLAAAGFNLDQIEGKRLHDLNIFPANKSWERMRELHRQGYEFRHEKMILRSNGQDLFLFAADTAPLRDYENRIKGTIVIMSDVTERTRLEAELFQTRMQSEKLASLGQLISGVAHEINNPLTAVIGCAEFLVEDCNLGEDDREAAQIIAEEARRSGRIVKSLLAFARQSAPEKTRADLNKIVETVMNISVYGLQIRNIGVIFQLSENLPLGEMDANQIQQVIVNLINNSADAIEESGIGDRVIVRTYAESNWLFLEVEDNGPGIPDDIKAKVFDPFFTTKDPGKGTGLGLSISYGIVKEHGGEIQLEAVEPHGCRMVVGLPAPKSEELPTTEPIIVRWIPGKTLVVDDETNIRLTLSNCLRELGSHVHTAADGISGLEKARNESYDLVLADFKMPKMDGMKFYQALLKERPELAERFVLMTGAQGKDVEQFREKTGNLILAKPFGRKDIFRVLSLMGSREGIRTHSWTGPGR
ncbi:MAG: PAS domain-containing protein [Desulfomonile tiedjei]|nr:PAS domain-containing protein [Desulfomonile tiedjei]